MRWTVWARDRTGFIKGSLLLSWGMVTFFSSFFWSSKVQVTRSALMRFGSLWDNSLVPEKNLIFLDRQSLVFRSLGAREYSHDLQAQKKAEMQRRDNAMVRWDVDLWNSWR